MTDGEKTEATAILAEAVHRIVPELDAQKKASAALLEDLVSLNGVHPDVRFEKIEGGIKVRIGTRTVTVAADNSEIVVCDQWGRERLGPPIPGLRYNPATKKLEGVEPDEAIAPAPGAPRQRRAASSVVLQAIMDQLIRPTY